MRIRGLTGLVVAGLVMALGVTSASGHRAQAPTSLELVSFADSNEDSFSDYIVGTVSSPKGKCEGSRTVKITRQAPVPGEPKLIDSTRTSKNGYWAGGGVEQINSIEGTVTVTRKTLGGLVCQADSVDFD
jgi:hypothetical protein